MTYSNSRDEEIFHGDFKTPEAAAVDAFNDDPALQEVWVGENHKQIAADFVNGERILEAAAECAYEECGECSEDWLSGLLRDGLKCVELEKLVGDWIQAQEPPNFWRVEHVRKITRGEMEDEGHIERANVD